MELKTATPLDQVLKQGFKGKAVELVSTYSHRSTLLKMREEIETRLKLTSGPLYMGEAEYLLLLPLCEAVRAANQDAYNAEVPRHAYQLAAAYAMIFDISKISQSKDIANQITLNSITAQPVIKAFMRRTKLSIPTSGKNGEPAGYKDQVQSVWSIISSMMTSVVYTPTNREDQKNTPLMVTYEATSAGLTEQDLASNSVNVWNTLLSQLRHGKGTPLDKDGRRAYMALISELLMRIDLMIDAAKNDVSVSGDELMQSTLEGKKIPAARTSFVDAYTAMYWLQLYLKSVDQYDVIFPATDLMVQSQAWVLIIKTQAAKFKKAYLDVAQVAMSYDIFTAMQMWNEVRRFYDPVLNHAHSVTADMDAIWQENESKAVKLLSSYAKSQTDQLVSSFKAYMEADYLLPEEEFHAASDIVDMFEFPNETDGVYAIPSGKDALLQLDSVGERQVSLLDRDLLVPGLAKSASAVETALAYIKRAREILQLSDETDDIYHALIPEGIVWQDPYSLSGTVGQLHVADFKFRDPMQLCYEKYRVQTTSDNKGTTIGSLDWSFTPLLMKPFYRVPQLLKFSQNRSPESRMLWQGLGELPIGDMITAQYVAQPLPACYTASRNANFVNNDFSAYLTLMSGKTGVTSSSRDMFRKLAAVLDKFEGTYSRGILDALAATMFVYKGEKGGSFRVLKPSLPTIYGMPTAAVLEENAITPKDTKEDVVMRRSIQVVLDNGNSYLFVLHAKLPKPGRMVYIAYPYAKGVYVHVPLLSAVFEQNRTALEKAMHVSFQSGNNSELFGSYDLADLCKVIYDFTGKQLGGAKFINTLGWAPYLVNLPHMMCTYQDEDDILLEEAYKKYALLSVRVRYDEVERAVYIGGFKDNPAVLLDVEDYDKSINEEDPSPLPPSQIVSVPEVEPDAAEPARAQAEQKPKPERMAPVPEDKETKLQGLAAITKAPVIDPASPDGDGLSTGAQYGEARDKKVATEPADAGAMAGDPNGRERQSADAEEAQAKEKYWKKLASDGSSVDVVKAVECPEGYVPASEEEYRAFVLKRESASEERA